MQFNFGIGDTYQWYVPTADKQRQPAARGKQRPPYARRIRPPYTYTELITQAITASSDRALTLRQIVSCLESSYTCFRGPYRGWRNSIRHNLSASECFRKILKDESKPNGKDNYWTMNEDCSHCKEKDALSKSNAVPVSRRTNGKRQKRDFCQVPTLTKVNNESDKDLNTTGTTEVQKVEGTEVADADDGSPVSQKLTDESQADINGSSCPENIHVTLQGGGHLGNSGDVAWQEMEGFNIERFTYNPCYDYSYDSNSSPQQMYDTDPQEHHTQMQSRGFVQSCPRPYPMQLATSQGYPMTHDMYRNGYCPPPYNMVDQHMFFQGSNPSHQQQYLKVNNGSFYGPGSQAAQQMQLMNNRVHQESVYYQ